MKILCSLILFIQSLLGSSLAVFFPFLEPCPFCLPLLFCFFLCRAQNFDVIFLVMTPLFIRDITSFFVMASFISSSLPVSNLTLFCPHFKIWAASLLCTLSILYLFCQHFVFFIFFRFFFVLFR